MSTCPEHRLRVFLSVDLVGSTAFKARVGDRRDDENDSHPIWVGAFKHFFREFPAFLDAAFSKLVEGDHDLSSATSPQFWKAIGDEIIFCCRVLSDKHLDICIAAFLTALDQYGHHLDGAGKQLDVKGSGWIAAFPAPNVTVQMAHSISNKKEKEATKDMDDEEFEVAADLTPSRFDFLGRQMDAGFRVSKGAQPDKFAVSLELAWLLTNTTKKAGPFKQKYTYLGREKLRGVLSDQPYPIIHIDCERSPNRQEITDRERVLLGIETFEDFQLHDFLDKLIVHEELDRPKIVFQSHSQWTDNYSRYRRGWEATNAIVSQQEKLEESAATASDSHKKQVPAAAKNSIDMAVALMKEVRGSRQFHEDIRAARRNFPPSNIHPTIPNLPKRK